MHAADGTPRERPRSADTPPANPIAITAVGDGDDEEGEHQDNDGDKEGGNSDADRVGNLNFGLAIEQNGCAVADVMLQKRTRGSAQ